MFTGIVEEMGVVKRLVMSGTSGQITVRARKVLEGTRIGDSIAVNGICLTVVSMEGGCFTADVMAETFRRSSLGACRPGDPVNLERAMAAGGRFGGHLVTGHLDGTGTVRACRKEGNAVWLTVTAQPRILRLIVEKGSVCVDGVSLTVAAVTEEDFSMSVIPHTGAETTLLRRRPGDLVNLENDVVGKYVEKLMGQGGDVCAGQTGAGSAAARDGAAGGRVAGDRAAGNKAAGPNTPIPSTGITLDFLKQYGF